MALIFLRTLFCMVSLGIAVLIFNSASMRSAPDWVPWVVLITMIGIPLSAILIDLFIKKKDLTVITSVYFGLLIGVFLTYVAVLALSPLLASFATSPILPWTPLILGMLLCYVSTSVLMQTRNDFRFIIPYVEFARDVRGLRPNVLDASAIVDGRIAELADTGLFQSRFVVPGSVMEDLQQDSDAVEKPKRMRGRRGLDVLSRLRSTPTIDVEILSHPGSSTQGQSIESEIVELARNLGGRVITNEPTLVKIAGVRGVPALNVNDIAVALRPSYVPGDMIDVKIVKQGEEPSQGVGFLDDGTMVVVEHGREMIGRSATVSVTSTLQTSAGRLVFARTEDYSD
ncbi:MAG: PIN/TRAM domain-containing protein [Planctomycetaceae bacterium]|jgi:uncharacterized protein YacL|nr:PIN/TRAM domain-containing protein [Planctomycetaceae bacterium]MBT6642924.1 PIN/TRAM domain-containing protein [Planctomycetaceae bacterium]